MLRILCEGFKEYKTPLAVAGVAIAAATYLYIRTKRSGPTLSKSANEVLLEITQNIQKPQYAHVYKAISALQASSTTSSQETTSDASNTSARNSTRNVVLTTPSLFNTVRLNSYHFQDDSRVVEVAETLHQLHAEHNPDGPTRQTSVQGLAQALVALTEYRRELESIRAITFSRDNERHIVALETFWSKLAPGVPLKEPVVSELDGKDPNTTIYKQRIVSPKWEEWAGFQGPDPATDVRGGGELALRNLCAFVTTYPEAAHSICEHGKQYGLGWFGMSIASINITVHVLRLLHERKLDRYIITRASQLGIEASAVATTHHPQNQWIFDECIFHELHAGVLFHLQRTWMKERPPNVMSFSAIFSKVLSEFQSSVQTGRFAPPLPNEVI